MLANYELIIFLREILSGFRDFFEPCHDNFAYSGFLHYLIQKRKQSPGVTRPVLINILIKPNAQFNNSITNVGLHYMRKMIVMYFAKNKIQNKIQIVMKGL